MMSPSDLQDIQKGYPFVLTAEDIGQYDVKYVGRQKVDEIDCYVFDVSPKVIEKKKRYLLGRIWVDTTDLQIVVTNGRMVPDDTRKGSEDLHPPFMTWRQQVDGHYWFPVYTKGEGILHFAGGSGYLAQDVHMRDTIKYSDYKRFGSTTKIIYDGQDITIRKPRRHQHAIVHANAVGGVALLRRDPDQIEASKLLVSAISSITTMVFSPM
jgi:hypothetical protein